MEFLIISILASVSVGILLKITRAHGFSIEQMVAVNYPIATALTLYFLQPDLSQWQQSILPNAWLFALLGVLLPGVFIIMGYALQHAGIVKTDAAQRLSLFIPVLAAFLLFGEELTSNRLFGLILAFIALFCLLFKNDHAQNTKSPILLLMGVWLGYGVIDILFKRLALTGSAFSGNLLIAFILAAVVMFAYLFWRKTRWHWQNLIAGILLGSLNFTNILFYLKAHQAFSSNPTLVFAGMNMGVIVLGTLAGTLLFKEKINRINILGIFLALFSIIILYFWKNIIDLTRFF